jgi:phospho-N-acetylmuramoyl-pentapeptide-transferase
MLYHLLYPLKQYFFAFNLFRYRTFRAAFAAMTAFLIGVIIGPKIIRMLKRVNISEDVEKKDSQELVDLHKSKAGTPTMGGLLIVGSILLSTFLWARLDNQYIVLSFVAVGALFALGFVDDYIKLRHIKSHGLRKKTKLAFEIGLGAVLAVYLYTYMTELYADGSGSWTAVCIPFYARTDLMVPLAVFVISTVLVIVGTSNAVNLTDGLDGLAIGCTIMAALVFSIVAYVAGNVRFSEYLFIPYTPGTEELSVFCAAILGASLAFLWFNCFPAEVFMGDTGALPLGGAIGYVAVACRQELLLFFVGGIFVAEAVSVIIQILYFKRTGKRFFRMAPLHHHFELKGLSETKITVRFCIVAAVLAVLSVAMLKVR